MFKRIAIVNRGVAAGRLIHAVRDINAEQPAAEPIRTIALYTDAEQTAMFAREADEAYPLGPAANRPYLDHALLERALRETRADAVWVGWGFVAEDPAFADLCEGIGVTFIGPSGDAMRKLGDKIGSKLIAEEVGVPVAPWSRGGVNSLDEALAAAERIGYPLMLKATAGGGGRGIRRVDTPADLEDAYQRTRDEAERAFGSGVVFLERLITGARHVEVQLIADGQGTAWALGVRDCSVQRRNQKVIEESASPLLSPEQADELKSASERLALAVGYKGAGTVEFLYHPGEQRFAFLEVNTRLQVEHPITEVTTSTDLVKAQIAIAAGGRLTGDKPRESGHAVEARLNAEDPDRDFAPSPGRIARLDLPSGPGVRVDTGVAEGDQIPADFDSMIAKIIAFGRDRDEALGRLRRAVGETTVVIEGGSTNKSFILDLLAQPEVTDGDPQWADTGWIDRVRAEGRLATEQHSGVALVAAAVEAYADEASVEVAQLLETAHGGRPQVRHRVGRPVDLKLRGTTYAVTALQTGPARYRVTVASGGEQTTVDVGLQRLDDVHSRLTVGGQQFRLVTATHGPPPLVEVNGVTHRVSRDEGGVLRSPAPALVVATPAQVGDVVAAGAPVVVLESMKMETVLVAPIAGRVKELMVITGSQVETGAPLVRLEPVADDAPVAEAPAAQGPGLDLPGEPAGASASERAARARADLAAVLMGFDLDPRQDAGVLAGYLAARDELRSRGVDVLADELTLVGLFADIAGLGLDRPADEAAHSELRIHSDRESFHRYLQSLDVERAGLPDRFSDVLARALAHYGVTDLARTDALDEAVFRVFLALQRLDGGLFVVSSLLEKWLGEAPPTGELATRARAGLDRLGRAIRRRDPVTGDLARSLRYRWFAQPRVDREREESLAHVRAEVAALAADPDAPRRAERIAALAEVPEQTVEVLAERIAGGIPTHEPMLEVLLARHYTDYDLVNLRSVREGQRAYAVGDYRLEGRPTRVVATVAGIDELTSPDADLANPLARLLARRGSAEEAVVELYVSWPDAPAAGEAAEALAEALLVQPWIRDVRRVVVAVCADADTPVSYLTFRWSGDTLAEDDRIRGVHPMVARRLDLWRLADFDVTRLAAPEDVLLFECVAQANPADRRLVALAQVRQLTVLRDTEGQLVGVPQAERAVENCLEAIRRVRASRGAAGRKLDPHHGWVQVRPVVSLTPRDVRVLQTRITPLGEDAGIEEVLAQTRFETPGRGVVPVAVRFRNRPGAGVTASIEAPPTEPLKPLDEYDAKVLRARRRGLVYPYEFSDVLAGPGGSTVEYDLDADGVLAPVERRPGLNKAGIICAVVTTPTKLHPEGVTRVVLSGDPTRGLGAVAEPECARIIAALDLAERLGVPVEWYTLSSGARISMESGTENMDWVGAALRRIIHFTQAGGEINVVVAGINVGAQPYWNAEATMLMHTRGILVMTPDSAMVLTGKQSLDFSGGVSAEDNFGIGGYDRVMGPNGQAQYWAPDLAGAFAILRSHYDHTYVVPGEAGPRRAPTTHPVDRHISPVPHSAEGRAFTTVGEIFSSTANPDRKKAFDIRTVMAAVCDADHPRLERWAGMADAETAVVMDARIGGYPVCLLGIESRPVPRRGFPPTDGPDTYTAGTLFPRSSKKAARAINAASGNRPLVVLANLSGFDGSPESMRNLQLEYGAEIGRAIVNFDGPIVFVVISRYHGGAFVVFSKRLNPRMTVLALEGSFASVIGGAPAAAVVFSGDVDKRTAADPRVREVEQRIARAGEAERAALRLELADLRAAVRAEKISEVAAEFDGVHNIHRAVEVGSVDKVIRAAEMRPQIVAALEEGLSR